MEKNRNAHFTVLHVHSHALRTIADAYFDIVIVISELSPIDYNIGIQILSLKINICFSQ